METQITSILSAFIPYLQIISIGGIIYGAAWWVNSAKSELFTKLDKITDNHLSHIQAGIESMADGMKEMHDQHTRAEVILEDIRESQRDK